MENKTNEELDKLIKHRNIVIYILALKDCVGSVMYSKRMPDTRTVKKIFK
jgi:hypothetical protein